MAAAILERGPAEAVISGALLRVLEDVIGLVDRLELGFLVGTAVVPVGVMLLGEAAVGGLDGGIVRAARHTQQLVIVALSHANIPTEPFGLSLSKPQKDSPSTG